MPLVSQVSAVIIVTFLFVLLEILIYHNTIIREHAEIYVVLQRSEIGLKIRESAAKDMQKPTATFESRALMVLRMSVAR